MKHFIYMNTEIINSYISQIESGLTVGNHQEVTDTTTEVKGKSRTKPQQQVEGKGTLGLVGITARLNSEINTQSSTLTQVEAGRELIDKILHDDSFGRFFEYLKKEGKIVNEPESKIGDYIKLNGNFEFWDLDYIIESFEDDAIDYIAGLSMDEEIKKFIVEKGKKPNKSDINNIKKKLKEPTEFGIKMIKLCKRILPYSKFVTKDNVIIPINDKFLREKVKAIRFKYDGEFTLIGRYTGDYLKNNINNNTNSFQVLFESLDSVNLYFIKDVLGIDIDSKIIEPIALYLE